MFMHSLAPKRSAASATLTAYLEHRRNIFLFRLIPPDSLPRQNNATASG